MVNKISNKEIHCQFVGQDGSCGYKYGEFYNLRISQNHDLIEIERMSGSGYCSYSTILTFLNNWKFISW